MLPIARNIMHMLKEKDLLSQSEIIDGSSIFAIARQRNRFCYYKRQNGPSYFIKTGHETEPGARRSMALEAAFYKHFAQDAAFAELRPYLTTLYDFDTTTATLISELISDAKDLTVMHKDASGEARKHLEKMAQCIALLHSCAADKIDRDAFGFDPRPHWIFRLSEDPGPLAQLRGRSLAGTALIDQLVASEAWMQLLRDLASDWTGACLIHGDIKPQNFLVHAQRSGAAGYKLIDWERANLGDPAWDVACGAVTPLMLRILQDGFPAKSANVSDVLTTSVRADTRAFFAAYQNKANAQSRELVTTERCEKMMIARLLAAAYEISFASDAYNPLSDVLLKTATQLSEDFGDLLISSNTKRAA